LFFLERFEDKLDQGWTWLRKNPQPWRIREGALDIRVESEVIKTFRNALVRKAPDRRRGKSAIDVTVTNITRPTQQYEQPEITWYHNGKPV
jgi:hypothetical protein